MAERTSLAFAGVQLTMIGCLIVSESNDSVWPTIGFITIIVGTYLVGRAVAKPVIRSLWHPSDD